MEKKKRELESQENDEEDIENIIKKSKSPSTNAMSLSKIMNLDETTAVATLPKQNAPSLMTVYVPSYSPVMLERFCRMCKQVITMDVIPVMLNFTTYHEACFKATLRDSPLETQTNSPPLIATAVQADGPSKVHSPPDTTPKPTYSDIVASVTKQPEQWQIAHYNVFPPPELTIETKLSKNERIHASLVEAESGIVLPHAFTKGTQHAYLPGSKTYVFSGLKLSRLNLIQIDLEEKDLPKKGCNFCIQFSIGTFTCKTSSFKIATTYQDLPAEEHKKRPYKRADKDGS
jgi:hypothetical protein